MREYKMINAIKQMLNELKSKIADAKTLENIAFLEDYLNKLVSC